MEKKYYIELISGSKSFNAGYKANIDLYKVLDNNGFRPLSCILQTGKSKITKAYHLLKECIRIWPLLNEKTIVLYVYPDIYYYDYLKFLLSLKTHRKVAFIMDINSLREKKNKFSGKDKKKLHTYDYLIVHTPAMRDLLINEGYQTEKLLLINMFDYLVDVPNKIERKNRAEVVYAGNLDKAEFLKKLPSTYSPNTKISFNLYGAESNNINESHLIRYKGKFFPNDLSSLEGSWGLVWDGTSTESCKGPYGQYLRYNHPHKTCMYLAAEMPVIVWEEAGMAPFILEHNLGITIKSINELPTVLSHITDEKYDSIIESVKKFSPSLRRGEMLTNVINKI